MNVYQYSYVVEVCTGPGGGREVERGKARRKGKKNIRRATSSGCGLPRSETATSTTRRLLCESTASFWMLEATEDPLIPCLFLEPHG